MSTLPDLRDSEDLLKSRVQAILDEARAQGASAAEVSVSEDAGLGVTVRMGELESVEFNHDRGFGITVYLEGRRGSASTSDSSSGAIRETVTAALNIARFTEEDPCAGLADPERLATKMPDLDLYHPWDVDAARAEVLAKECEAAGLAQDERIVNSDGASVSTQRSLKVYGNSHGFIGRHLGSRHSISCMLIGRDDGGMQRDYWYTTARRADDLEGAGAVGAEAGRRTAARLSPQRPRTGSFPVAFAPQAAAGLAGHLLGAISGGAQYRRASFLLDALGESVAAEHLTLAEDPTLPRGIGSATFDGEGVATTAKAFIDRGVVASYILSSYSGRKLGLPTTGNAGGVHNLTVTGSTVPLAELFTSLGNGLLVTDLMGQGVNPVTGDYSRGASGFWIESGEIAYPVDEITVASNLRDMLAGVVCLGDDLDTRGNLRAPTLLIERMTVAGS